eukprot:CAMPEP_0170566754 /NCGR_PEP_ID=MMETSP0211-20121228/80039_1 /TAXON_ID=311385 /ORGANISM="Pseudokeronopsis sp., Strain OXSARD2" /LENGTH=74 /DNA_ID=CAMNT_0010888013 /DNA_START=863 /DNA_END=1087 /DNA_ORIENTATION=-
MKSDLSVSDSDLESERKMMLIGDHASSYPQTFSNDTFKKIESKDSMWKPAPIYGREISANMSCNVVQPKVKDYQ